MAHSLITPLEGLSVHLDRLLVEKSTEILQNEDPYAFIYFLTINNNSNRTITLLGRKWVLNMENGKMLIIEGDKIIGKTPTLSPANTFTYNSCHTSTVNTSAKGAFYVIDQSGSPIYTSIPEFDMIIPADI